MGTMTVDGASVPLPNTIEVRVEELPPSALASDSSRYQLQPRRQFGLHPLAIDLDHQLADRS